MKATEARRATARSISRIRRKDEADARRSSDMSERAADERYPSALKEAERDVKAATKAGHSTCEYQTGHSRIADKLVNHFTRLGYKVTSRFVRETSNMGDFNAPCNVDTSHFKVLISWER